MCLIQKYLSKAVKTVQSAFALNNMIQKDNFAKAILFLELKKFAEIQWSIL